MPRLIQILNRFVIGGPAYIIANLTKNLSPEFESILIVGGKDEHEKDAKYMLDHLGIHVVTVEEMRRDINPLLDFKAYRSIKKIISDFKPDIVHTHAAKAGMIGRLAARHAKVPSVVHTFHGHVFHSYFGRLKTNAIIQTERYLASVSTGIVAISNQQKNALAETFTICSSEKIKVIPLGLELEKFSLDQEIKRHQFRKKYFIKDDEIAIGLIGRIVPIKNHEFFIQVAETILATTQQKVRFLIIGDGDRRPKMEAAILQAGIDYSFYPEEQRAATIQCTSWITEIDIALAGLDIVALTSHNEGTPVSLMEAQAAGKPVISTNVGGVVDVVQDGITGYLSNPGNLSQYVHYLETLIGNESQRIEMGQAGRHFMQQHFSNQTLLNNTTQYYKQLLNGHL